MNRSQKDLEKDSAVLKNTVNEYWETLGLQLDFDRLQNLKEKANDPKLWDNPETAKKVTKDKNLLEERVTPWFQLKKEINEFPELMELTLEESKEAGLVSLNEDLDRLFQELEALEMSYALSDPDDAANCYINIHPGAGGTESQDWAEMLLRMYSRYFEKQGYRTTTVEEQAGDTAGIKNATLYVQGDKAFGYLKGESGVHRLVRISPFDSNQRRHTSFASVHVSPEMSDEINIQIEEKDLRIDVYRSSGAGGQHVNTTDSAVRMTHIPSGIVVSCQNERSQIKNRETAMKMLKSRLYELEKRKQQEELEKKSGEKRDIAWGSQIRSYVFHPYNMVKDHRTDHETAMVQNVMNGDLQEFINSYLKSLVVQKKKETHAR